MTTVVVQQSTIHILPNPVELGKAAANEVAQELRSLLASQPKVRMIFAAAPSQSQMLHHLAAAEGIDWARVVAFHMDEYVGLPEQAPQRFGHWLRENFFDRVPLGIIHLIEPGSDAESTSAAYSSLLAEAPIDIVCLGIGMNGHLAFNDPPADFREKRDVRVVELEERSRIQQVEEGLFPSVADVPTHAISLSIPCMLRAKKMVCCVSGTLKTAAVTRAFTGEVDPSSPASILREHAGCSVYLDVDAAAGLNYSKER